MSYKINEIDDYQNRLTGDQEKLLIRHCNKYGIKPCICAWYDDMDDFYSDWCDDIGYSKTDARSLLSEGDGQFKKFKDGQIIRLVL